MIALFVGLTPYKTVIIMLFFFFFFFVEKKERLVAMHGLVIYNTFTTFSPYDGPKLCLFKPVTEEEIRKFIVESPTKKLHVRPHPYFSH